MQRVARFVGFGLYALIVVALVDWTGVADVSWPWEKDAAHDIAESPLPSGHKAEVCTVSDITDKGATNGILYAVNGSARKRSDITITSRNTTIVMHLLVDSQVAYLWGSGNKGTILPAKESSVAEILGQFRDSKCQDWTPNNSVFQIPTHIKFTDITKDNALSRLGENSTTIPPETSQPKPSPQPITKQKTQSNQNPSSAGYESKRGQQERKSTQHEAPEGRHQEELGDKLNRLQINLDRSTIRRLLEAGIIE